MSVMFQSPEVFKQRYFVINKLLLCAICFVFSLTLGSIASASSDIENARKMPPIIYLLLSDEEEEPTSKNILLIVGDDIGVDNISGYGEHPDSAVTPTLDQLASDGVLFRNTWASPQCSPSRASLLTGRNAFRHGVTHPGNATRTLISEEETLAEILSTAGYQTGLFGKWHLGDLSGVLPTDQGFDYYSGSLIEAVADYYAWEKTVITSQGGTATTINETNYATKVVAEESVAWINNTTGPWFAEVSFNAPHSPFHVPPLDRFTNPNMTAANSAEGDSCQGPGTNDIDDCYRAAAEAMDSYIADIIAQIDPEKLADTLIVFVGDNGTPGNVTIELPGYPFASNHAKTTVYEGGVNVPLIIAGGSNVNISAGTEIADLIQIQDVFSTVSDIAGAQSSSGITIDGQSLLGYLDTSSTNPTARTSLFSELTNSILGIDIWAHSSGIYKYIFNSGDEECYDLVADPGELINTTANPAAAACITLKANRPALPDSDGDGFHDGIDVFPNDPLEWLDTDGDGVGDNGDAFPNSSSETMDTDGDGVGDNADAFPNDPTETLDTDGDMIGNNADLDDDGDMVNDGADAFPLDATETIDTDSDGIGNNADFDDDGDGYSDAEEIIAGTDPLLDSDSPTGIPTDTDADGIADALDSDIDGDGTGNIWDAFPFHDTEWADTDGDGIINMMGNPIRGDNADPDIDGDGVNNGMDRFPYNADWNADYELERHSAAWLINSTNAASVIVDQGTPYNVQSVDQAATDSAGNPAARVQASSIPNYEFLMTEESLDFINGANPLGRINGQAVWRDNGGVETSTAVPGLVVEFGEDINYNSRTDTAANPGCSVGEGYGYWPPGPGCANSFNPTSGTDNLHDGLFPLTPIEDDANACFAGAGKIGFMINGIAIYGYTDALSFDADTATIQPTPLGGDNIWRTNAPFWEYYDVDVCIGHAPARGEEYHHHAWSQCLATMSGDTGAAHSPIVGFMADGYALHGPYHNAGILAQSAWLARDYSQTWNPANGEYGCDGTGARTCTIDDPYDPDNSTVTTLAVGEQGPDVTTTVPSISSNNFVAASGAFLEDYYLDPTLLASTLPKQLDENNGHSHGNYGYHYHMTITASTNALGYDFAFPYTVGPQFKGQFSPADGAANQCPSSL